MSSAGVPAFDTGMRRPGALPGTVVRPIRAGGCACGRPLRESGALDGIGRPAC
jgi:hypothetical protein